LHPCSQAGDLMCCCNTSPACHRRQLIRHDPVRGRQLWLRSKDQTVPPPVSSVHDADYIDGFGCDPREAGGGDCTLDLFLGKEMLLLLSYTRMFSLMCSICMAVGTDDLTLLDFLEDRSPSSTAGKISNVADLLPTDMVELHLPRLELGLAVETRPALDLVYLL
jgi:hypothetical protein